MGTTLATWAITSLVLSEIAWWCTPKEFILEGQKKLDLSTFIGIKFGYLVLAYFLNGLVLVTTYGNMFDYVSSSNSGITLLMYLKGFGYLLAGVTVLALFFGLNSIKYYKELMRK